MHPHTGCIRVDIRKTPCQHAVSEVQTRPARGKAAWGTASVRDSTKHEWHVVTDRTSPEATLPVIADDAASRLEILGGASGAALAELLPSLAAVARAMEQEFHPRRFLDAFSTQLQPLVPHDRVAIVYLEDERRTFSIFAEHAGPGLLPKPSITRRIFGANRGSRSPTPPCVRF